MPNQPLPEHLREFDDTEATRALIYDNALKGLQERFPIEDKDYRLELHNPRYTGPQTFTLEQQKQALLKGRQLRSPVTATWRLIHRPTDTVLDEREDVVMHVPYYTDRGTWLHNGSEYSIASQSRLRPGVYIRRQKTGDIESHFNVKPGTGKQFRLHMDPESGVFKVNVGQANIPLYPLLKTLGVDDQQIMKHWGPELTAVNAAKQDKKALEKYYERFSGYKFDPAFDDAAKTRYLQEALPAMQLDPDVMARTLGIKDATGVTPAVLLRATQKMLAVSRGTEDPDDRDHPMYSNIYGIEDMVHERIKNDAGKTARSLMFRLRRDKNLQRIPRGALNPYFDGILFGSGLANPLDETNPLSNLEQLHRITKLGEGGIASAESVSDEAREVNNGQFGFIDPICGPEAMNAGIDIRAAYKTFKGRDNKLYAEFRDPKTEKIHYLTPEQVHDSTVAFPGEMQKQQDTVQAMRRGKLEQVKRDTVDFEVPSVAHQFSPNINLNAMPTAVQPARQFYAAKFWTQFMPMKDGEVPLVDNLMPGQDKTFSEYYGQRTGALSSKVQGTVTKVTPDSISVVDQDGQQHDTELVQNLPFNRLSAISYRAAVKPGDIVQAGDMLANSNFTDAKTGGFTMGRNLKVAITPYKNFSYEDAVVLSSAAAQKLATDRLYGFDQDTRDGVEIDAKRYMSIFPDKFTKQQIESIDDRGIVKRGTVLNYGDPVVLAVGPKLLTARDAQLGKLHKVLRSAHTDKALTWEHEYPGTVVDAEATSRGARINVKAQPPLEVGDKVTAGGLKGIVGKILGPDEMPRDAATNEPYEMLMNPMGILSRVTPDQLMAVALAKVAKKTGKQIRLNQLPPPEGWAKWTQQQLDDAGVRDKTDIYDPGSKKVIKNIADGYVYLHAMHHLGEKKLSSRSDEGAYTFDEQPARGGEHGAKRFGFMNATAVLAHGCPEIIKDAHMIRGTRNDEYWKALRLGLQLPEPKVPFIYDKFLATLKAGGINVVEKGDISKLMPMTDAEVDRISSGTLRNSESVDHDMKPREGGLFDPGITGADGGKKWSTIKLGEPVPNPVMEEPIRRLLGLTGKAMMAVQRGDAPLEGMTGGAALKKALAGIDIDKAMEYHKARIYKTRGTDRDNSIKAMGYLEAAKRQGIHPADWMITKVPVIPPIFRPVATMGNAVVQADLNELYRDVFESNRALHSLRKELPDNQLGDERQTVYEAVKAAYGLGESITPEGRAKRLKGAVRQVTGDSPSSGMFQSKLLSRPTGIIGRGVMIPNPNFDMDTIGLPDKMAWTVYKDFVVRRMVQRGYSAEKALEQVHDQSDVARKLLIEEMGARPVLMDRAPVWHKFNMLAFNPVLIKGNAIQANPLTTKGFSLDFDGDQCNVQVPVSDKAVKAARSKMMPSKALFSLTDLKSVRHSPSMEATLGLWAMTQPATKKPAVRFPTAAAARAAYHAGQININDPIEIP